NTVEVVTRRAGRLLAMWEPLATLRYIGAPKSLPAIATLPGLNQTSIDLDELVAELFAGPLALWAPEGASTSVRLEHALGAMARACAGESRERVLARMVELARTNPRTKGTAAADPAAIAGWFDALSADSRAELVPGNDLDLVSELYQLK